MSTADDRQEHDRERRVPAKALGQTRRAQRREHRTGISRADDAHGEPLVLRGVPSARQGQGDGEARARHAEQEAEHVQLRDGVCAQPPVEERPDRHRQADQAGSPSADPIGQRAENGPEAGSAQKGNGHEQALLRGGQREPIAQERRERAEKDPHHEADVEVEQRPDECRQMAALEKTSPRRHAAAPSAAASASPGIWSSTIPSSTRAG